MGHPDPLLRFFRFSRRPLTDADVVEGALLIAAGEYPELDVAAEKARIHALADELEPRVAGCDDFFHVIHAVNHLLFVELGLRGNRRHYDDPDNSMLHKVLERRLGIPITLSVLWIAIARRLGAEARGVGFPGHFIVRLEDRWGETLVDPFHRGRVLLQEDLARRLSLYRGAGSKVDPDLLQPADARAILTRMLHNLRSIYLRRQDYHRALGAAERLVMLHPQSAGERRSRGLLYSYVGEAGRAIHDLQIYLGQKPEAPDARRIRHLLQTLQKERSAEG